MDRRTVFVVLIVVFAFVAFRMVVANLLRVITESYPELNTESSVATGDVDYTATKNTAQAAMAMFSASTNADVDQEFEF